MTLEQFGIIAEIVASIATVGALIGLVYEMRKSRQYEANQTFLGNQQIWRGLRKQILMEKELSWESYEDFQSKYKYGDEEKYYAYLDILNFFEQLGENINIGLYEKLPLVRNFGYVAISYWNRYYEVIMGRRIDEARDDYLVGVEFFVDEAKKHFLHHGEISDSVKAKLKNMAKKKERRESS